MANPLIKITNIKRDFVLGNEIVYVLKGIDLQINKGEYVALMGPSGSGKSTLMNLLGCLDTPTSGQYVLNGKDVSQMRDDELALADIKENNAATEKINTSKIKYEEFRNNMVTILAPPAPSPKQQLRNALFGEGKIGEDMSFAWVNAKNIHSVYQQFVHTVEKNKDSYSREDWDEIKLMYEALDSRKNTVEKEGLTGEDNRKIAGLKLKFAPMYTLNRMGAKSEETAAAKK
jgi:ABC-type oligopeptide transport system ATPase subunit